MTKLQTISPEYVDLNRQLHEAPRGFGGDGGKRVSVVLPLLAAYPITRILDYGCGQGKFREEMVRHTDAEIVNYDPAIPKWSQKPDGLFDLVVCTDVLEHVEPQFVMNVLEEIHSYTNVFAVLLIAFTEANKVLPDGRNAHLIQEGPLWWEDRLNAFQWRILEKHYYPDKTGNRIKKGLYILGEVQ